MSPIRSLHEDRPPRVQALLLGHIRLGTFTGRNPQESQTLIFTAADRNRLVALAQDFGGEIAEYEPQGAGTERWRLISETESLTALFPFPSLDGNVTQDFELWGRGGIKRRCDGVEAILYSVDEVSGEVSTEEAPCVCEAQDKAECAAVTRVNLLLPQTGIGVWTLRTQSKIAAIHLWDQARFINELSGGRMHHLPVRVTWKSREISYFDQKAQKRKTTKKRVVSLSIAGDAERVLRGLSLPADRALIETVRVALEDAGRTLELETPGQRAAIEAGSSSSEAPSQGDETEGGADPAGATGPGAGVDTPSQSEAPAGDPERPAEDPIVNDEPHKGKHLSQVAQEDPSFVQGLIRRTRVKKRKEIAQAWLDFYRPTIEAKS